MTTTKQPPNKRLDARSLEDRCRDAEALALAMSQVIEVFSGDFAGMTTAYMAMRLKEVEARLEDARARVGVLEKREESQSIRLENASKQFQLLQTRVGKLEAAAPLPKANEKSA